MQLQPAFQAAEVERTALAGDFTAPLEDGQGRDAADVEAGGELLLGLGVDLDQAGITGC